MPKLKWDENGERLYETGIDHGVLYPISDAGTYPAGYVWNGLSSVSESPEGADSNPIYADNIKYLDIRSAEEFNGTIEAYTFPNEWEQCDGMASPVPGVVINQQSRKAFGLAYRTILGNDVKNNDYGYKLHLIYNATAAPSEKSYETVNDSPEAITFSWEFTTTPISTGEDYDYKPCSLITIDSTLFKTTAEKARLQALEDALFGTNPAEGESGEGTVAYLPLPEDVFDMLKEPVVPPTP